MANQMPIYSVVPKSQYRQKTKFKTTRESELEDSKDKNRKKEERKKDTNEGKVEAYLRQNQLSMRQQRQSAVRQAEHRVNLRSLPLNEVTSRQERTPTERHKPFPERERDSNKEKRDRNRERDGDIDGSLLSPREKVRKSTSSHKMVDQTPQRRFICREWLFQKIAHCLEQKTASKTCGAVILGDAGTGKTSICQELSEPGQGPQARQQRALNRRLLARHFMQSNSESSHRPAEFIRSFAMQILSHSDKNKTKEEIKEIRDEFESSHTTEEDRLVQRFRELGDDSEEINRPLLNDSEDQRTDDEESDFRKTRTINRIHEKMTYVNCIEDAPCSRVGEIPEIMPRLTKASTNPFLSDNQNDQETLYENHENVFLRNMSHRNSNRQSPDVKSEKSDSPHKSRIPVANFKYPNKIDLTIESPKKSDARDELPEYQNFVKKPDSKNGDLNRPVFCDADNCIEDVTLETDDVPPPVPTLPITPRNFIANAYYEKILTDRCIQESLLPQNLESKPDDCFKRAILFPLLEIDPPKQCLFIVVDAIDDGLTDAQMKLKSDPTEQSTTIYELLAKHQHLLPPWLLLVITCRKQAKQITHTFTGFRKISIDELQRTHVSADVQRYVLARLDTEPRLRARLTSDSSVATAAAVALDNLRIKSDGCILYLEKVLDGVADGFIALREIKEIPGTLNGLYLWLAQRLFHGRRFAKVRLLLEVLLAARCGVTEDMLYKCLLTKEYSVSREDFNRRLHLLRRVLLPGPVLRLFHHSFSNWLKDVKHCTRRFLCSEFDGHAALAMYYTLDATRLTPIEIHNYVLHITNLEKHILASKKKPETTQSIDTHTLLLLWVIDSGCDVESVLKKEIDAFSYTEKVLNQTFDISIDSTDSCYKDNLDHSESKNILESLIPDGTNDRWPRDSDMLKSLLQISRSTSVQDNITECQPPLIDLNPLPPELESPLDPQFIHELIKKGDDQALDLFLQRVPNASTCVSPCGSCPLVSASRNGRPLIVRLLLNRGADVNQRDIDGTTALRAAAHAGHIEVVEVLLEHGCDVDAVDADNRTALRGAAWSGHLPVVERLLKAGACVDLLDASGRSPLTAAAYMAHQDIVRALLDAGADPNVMDCDGRTALYVCALSADGCGCAALLLERGATNQMDHDGATPLLVAAFEGHTATCELLLENEADIEASDLSGRSPLWASASAGHADTVRLLLFWGATVDHMDDDGRTVLTVAAAHGNVDVVKQLLDRGLDENHRDNSGWTPLHYAAFEGHVDVCIALLEGGARVDEPDRDAKRPLALAASAGHTNILRLLTQYGADATLAAHDGNTAARLAALEGHIDCVDLLFSMGCDVDTLDLDGRSTLYVLALDNKVEMARHIILNCGANVENRDSEGRTPLHVSAWQGHVEMVDLLVTLGRCDVNAIDNSSRTALHCAAWRGRGSALRALLNKGAQVQPLCAQGATPLGIAAQEGHEECVLVLLEYGADPFQADHCGRTPAKVAWRAGHVAVCRLLEAHAKEKNNGSVAQSPDLKRRSMHSSNSKCSSITAGSIRSHERNDIDECTKLSSQSFVSQVSRRSKRREKERDSVIHEELAVERDGRLRSYTSNERDADIVSLALERDRRGDTSPLYVSPPNSDSEDERFGSQPSSMQPLTDNHFSRDTHMRIILGRENKNIQDKPETKTKRNGIVTNPAMRLVANVKNGLDTAAANIRRTGVAIANSASAANPAVKTNAFQWRKETPL